MVFHFRHPRHHHHLHRLGGGQRFRRVVTVRPHNVFGADMGFEHVVPQFALRMHGLRDSTADPVPFPIQGDGQQTRSFVYIDDFTDGVVLDACRAGARRGLRAATAALVVEDDLPALRRRGRMSARGDRGRE